MARNSRDQDLRSSVAREAARILADWGDQNYSLARRKAAKRLNASLPRQLPDNREIEQALREYQQLFLQERQPAALRRLRLLAVDAMKQFEQFRPRLCGPVFTGTADAHTPLRLQLFAHSPEEVLHKLISLHIPWEEAEAVVRYSDGSSISRPLFGFQAGESRVELLVLPLLDERNPPISPLDGRPERGGRLSEVIALADSPDAGTQRSETGT